jgi:hypothetical protein
MNTQTKKSRLVTKGFSYISKKSTIVLAFLLISIVVYATINFPPDLTTRGTLPDDIELCAGCDLTPEWTFINETGCPVSIRQSVNYNGPDGSGIPFRFETIEVPAKDPVTLINGQATISYGSMYQQLSAQTGTSGPFTLTHAGVEIQIAGNWGHFGYPDKPTKFCNPALDANDPCRCIQWTPDYANKIMRLVPCLCP